METQKPTPIPCPQCGLEIIPHGNEIVPHRKIRIERLQECLRIAKDAVPFLRTFMDGLPDVEVFKAAIDIGKTLYVELNDFEISENIARDKMKTSRYIAAQKKANIKAINK